MVQCLNELRYRVPPVLSPKLLLIKGQKEELSGAFRTSNAVLEIGKHEGKKNVLQSVNWCFIIRRNIHLGWVQSYLCTREIPQLHDD